MPTSSSSSSSSSSSFSSSSSSSSNIFFTASKTDVTAQGCFEILAQTGNSVIINSGVGYDGYGNRLYMADRRVIALDWSAVTASEAYLCIRRRDSYKLIDYQDHPVYCLPRATKTDVDVEFYLAEGVLALDFGNGLFGYYPPLDTNLIILGLVLGQVYENGTQAPSIVPWRSPYLAVRDGVFFPLVGFNTD